MSFSNIQTTEVNMRKNMFKMLKCSIWVSKYMRQRKNLHDPWVYLHDFMSVWLCVCMFMCMRMYACFFFLHAPVVLYHYLARTYCSVSISPIWSSPVGEGWNRISEHRRRSVPTNSWWYSAMLNMGWRPKSKVNFH